MSFNTVKELGKEFRTSLMATASRLVQYGSYPALFAWYNMETGERINMVPGPEPSSMALAT